MSFSFHPLSAQRGKLMIGTTIVEVAIRGVDHDKCHSLGQLFKEAPPAVQDPAAHPKE